MRPSASVWQCASLSEILFLFCPAAQAPSAVQIQGKRIGNRCKSTVTCGHQYSVKRSAADLQSLLPGFENHQLTKFSSLCCRSIAARGRQSLCALGGQDPARPACVPVGSLSFFLLWIRCWMHALKREREGSEFRTWQVIEGTSDM